MVSTRGTIVKITRNKRIRINSFISNIRAMPTANMLNYRRTRRFRLQIVNVPSYVRLLTSFIRTIRYPLITISQSSRPINNDRHVSNDRISIEQTISGTMIVVITSNIRHLTRPIPLQPRRVRRRILINGRRLRITKYRVSILGIHLRSRVLRFNIRYRRVTRNLTTVDGTIRGLNNITLLIRVRRRRPPKPSLYRRTNGITNNSKFTRTTLRISSYSFYRYSRSSVSVLEFLQLLQPTTKYYPDFLRAARTVLYVSYGGSTDAPCENDYNGNYSSKRNETPHSESPTSTPASSTDYSTITLYLVMVFRNNKDIR